MPQDTVQSALIQTKSAREGGRGGDYLGRRDGGGQTMVTNLYSSYLVSVFPLLFSREVWYKGGAEVEVKVEGHLPSGAPATTKSVFWRADGKQNGIESRAN